MTALDSLTPTQDERILAALSHVSAIIPFMGVIAPIVIWATQREKSQYVAFQALQAVVFQLCIIVLWIIGWGCYMASFFATFATMPFMTSKSSKNMDSLFILVFMIPFGVLDLIMLGQFISIVYGMIAAVMAVQGKPFRYIIIGDRVKSFMAQK